MEHEEYDPKCGWNWDESDLHPLETPLAEHRARLPPALAREAERRRPPTTPFHRLLAAQLGTPVLFDWPVYLPEIRTGYILDFLIPGYSVSLEVADPAPEDPDAIEWIVTRDNDLMAYEGILTLRFPPERVRDAPEQVLAEIREALGLGAPVAGGQEAPVN